MNYSLINLPMQQAAVKCRITDYSHYTLAIRMGQQASAAVLIGYFVSYSMYPTIYLRTLKGSEEL
jgi:hypothetical protein